MTPPPSLQDLIDTVQQDSPTDDQLDLLITASAAVSHLEAVNDALLEHFVGRCRRAGRSWSEISSALHVSKQAVHKRFSASIADRVISAGRPTLERFTSRARSVLGAADAAARAGQRGQVGAEDLLIGLFAEPEGLAARALAAMNVSQAAVEAALLARSAAERAAAATPAGGAPLSAPGEGGRLPYSPDAVTALRDAVAEALDLGHNYIGTEHILLGLLRDPDAPAAQILAQLGASPAGARVRITEMLRGFTKGSASS